MIEKYNGETLAEDVTCGNCLKTHDWDSETCAVYRGYFICESCFQDHFGYCNGCHELFKYDDMNNEIYCKECE